MTDPTPATCALCGEPMPPGEEMFVNHGFSGPCPKPPLQQGAAAHSELGHLLRVLVQSVGATDPRAFEGVDIEKAIIQADRCVYP